MRLADLPGIVVHGPPSRKRFALTFDDGPERGVTDRLLDLLAGRGVRATFFCVGEQVERDPELAREILSERHEIGCHTMRHLDHAEVGRDRALADIADGAAVLERLLGAPLRLYRPPYGHFVPATLGEAERRGWLCVLWSAWGRDWLPDDGARIASRILDDFGPGAIVLLHDARRYAHERTDCGPTIDATEILLSEAERQEMQPVTLTQLIYESV